jgi:hypothetical protein
VRIDPPDLASVRYILDHARERDRRETSAVCGFWDPAQLAEAMVDDWLLRGAWGGVFSDGDPIAVLTMLRETPRSLQVGMLATDEFPRIALPVTRYVRRVVDPLVRKAGFTRMECRCWSEHHDARRWLQVCGAKQEAEIPGYGASGETFIQFAWS